MRKRFTVDIEFEVIENIIREAKKDLPEDAELVSLNIDFDHDILQCKFSTNNENFKVGSNRESRKI